MIFLQLSAEPAASERARWRSKGVAGFLVRGASEGKTVTPPLFGPARFEEALEAAFSERPGGETLLRLRPFSIDAFVDRIVETRMRAAAADSIKASYRVLLGRIGISTARLAFRRLKTALNSARFAAFREKGGAAPRLLIDLVEAAAHGAETTRRYAAECFDSEAVLLLSPRQLPMLDGWEASGPGLADAYAEAKFRVDKLANYQIDLNQIAADLERIG